MFLTLLLNTTDILLESISLLTLSYSQTLVDPRVPFATALVLSCQLGHSQDPPAVKILCSSFQINL